MIEDMNLGGRPEYVGCGAVRWPSRRAPIGPYAYRGANSER